MTEIKIYPAPFNGTAVSTLRPVFTLKDVERIASKTRRSVVKGKADLLVAVLNEGLVGYFSAARTEGAGTASEFARWAARVERTSEAFLGALGVEPGSNNASFPLAAQIALFGPFSSKVLKRYSNEFDQGSALHRTVFGAALVRDLARDMSKHFESREKASKTAAKRDRYSPRQIFVLHLAPLYEACFCEQMPKLPQPGASPFLRFAREVFSIVAERVTADAEPVTDPDDGADNAAARLLTHASEAKIATDVREVYDDYISQRDGHQNDPRKIIARARRDFSRRKRRQRRG